MSGDLEERVRAFVARETGTRVVRLTMDSTLVGELGVDGADGWEFVEAFGEEFGVDLAGFDPAKHFGPEAASFPPAALFQVIRLTKCNAHESSGLVPISVRDLVDAARERRWLK